MPQCPDCKSIYVGSKGWRIKGVHRYLCNNCGRNFTIDQRKQLPDKIQEEVNSIEAEAEAELNNDDKKAEKIREQINNGDCIMKKEKIRNTVTLNVRVLTKERVMGIRVHERETIDDILNRLVDEHYNKRRVV